MHTNKADLELLGAKCLESVGGKRMLVVDDSRDSADSLAIFLSLSGNDVRTAYDGRQALAIAAAFQPQVAFLDIELPDLDGIEIACQMRAGPHGALLLLVATTSLWSAQDRSRIRSAGFDHYLQKPFEFQEVTHLLSGRSPRA